MKTWADKVREAPVERLVSLIEAQKREIATMKWDLELMERILAERSQNPNQEEEKR